ncbi:hypothetical protein I4U23_028410 [Adineta vaga]|nr:hypothetical protein I4U23_028410 [Adineta vaga]
MYNTDEYEKLLPLNSPSNLSVQTPKENLIEEISSSSILSKEFRNDLNLLPTSSSISTLSSIRKSTETTKSFLIQRILNSLKLSSSDSTTNTSLSSINEAIFPCQSQNLSNKIYLNFRNENELGRKPSIDDLLETIKYHQNCSCHLMEISFNDDLLNQHLSFKQKQSILCIILRQQQLFHRYFS